jgi:hypothetical protein
LQLVDFNPGIAPSGLFWTTRLASGSVSGVNPGAGHAVYSASDIRVLDFHTIENALFGGGPTPTPGVVSFEVRFWGVTSRSNVKNPGNNFAGEFVRGQAQMEWSATSGDYHYMSAPMSTSKSEFAELGHERNGTFFPH